MAPQTSKVVSMRMSREEHEELEILAESEGYKNRAELIRTLIRKEWDRWAKKVIKHAKEHPEEYTSLEDAKKELLD